MAQVSVTLVRADTNQEFDVELPDDAPIQELLPALVKELGLPLTGPDGNQVAYELSNKRTGRELKEAETLGLAATKTGDVLLLTSTFVAGATAAKVESPVVLTALESVREASEDGILHPEDVVEAARPRTSPLHRFFTWDDTEAARQQRLSEARHLIRVTVTILPGTNQSVRAYVSLTVDRPTGEPGNVTGGGGFRHIDVVLSNTTMREQLLADVLQEMSAFQRKYSVLSELAEVFSAMRRGSRIIKAKSKSKKGRAR